MGFEIIVRPVVMPNIRPTKTPRRVQPQEGSTADPEKGIAVIRGNGFHQGTTTYNWSGNSSSSRPTEVKRRADTARVYQKKDDGEINKENFVDINVANKFWKRGGDGEKWTEFYKPQKEEDNIEITKRDVVEEHTGGGSGGGYIGGGTGGGGNGSGGGGGGG